MTLAATLDLLLATTHRSVGEDAEVFPASDFLGLINTQLISFVVQALDLCDDS